MAADPNAILSVVRRVLSVPLREYHVRATGARSAASLARTAWWVAGNVTCVVQELAW